MRAWPDILDWLSRKKRVTWTLVSANAQPLSFDGSRLVLAIETAGLAETFRRGAHPAFVQEALLEVLGIDAKVEGVVSDAARDAGRGPTAGAAPITTPASLGGPAPQSQPTPPVPEQSRPTGPASAGSGNGGASDARGSRTGEGSGGDAVPDFMPTRPTAVGGPDWSSAPPASSSAPSWATDGDDPLDRAPSRGGQAGSGGAGGGRGVAGGGPGSGSSGGSSAAGAAGAASTASAPAPPSVVRPEDLTDDPDAISDDDEDIEASGEVGTAVVERLLGGTVISESDE